MSIRYCFALPAVLPRRVDSPVPAIRAPRRSSRFPKSERRCRRPSGQSRFQSARPVIHDERSFHALIAPDQGQRRWRPPRRDRASGRTLVTRQSRRREIPAVAKRRKDRAYRRIRLLAGRLCSRPSGSKGDGRKIVLIIIFHLNQLRFEIPLVRGEGERPALFSTPDGFMRWPGRPRPRGRRAAKVMLAACRT